MTSAPGCSWRARATYPDTRARDEGAAALRKRERGLQVASLLSELVVGGRFESLDLSRLGYQRVLDNAPYPELGII